MTRLTVRGLLAHRRRLLSTCVAVLLGVAFMAGSLIFSDTMHASMSGAFRNGERGTDVLVRGPVTIETGQGTQHGPVDGSLATRLAEVPGVAAVAPRTEGFAQVLGRDGKPVDALSRGATPAGAAWAADDALNPFDLAQGRAPRADDEVVVDRSTAEAADLSVGAATTVLTAGAPQRMTVVGVATFAGADNRAGSRTVLFTPAAADRLLQKRGEVDAFALRASDGVSQGELARRVRAVLPGGDQAVTGAALSHENRSRSNEDVDFFSMFMTVFAVVALLVGAFIISNTFTILVAQRTRELALLRAIGAGGAQVRRSVVLEALAVGALASAAGVLAGIGVARGIYALFSSIGVTMPEGTLVVSGSSLAIAFAIGVVVTVLSALLPARRAARIAPIAAMRSVAVERTRPSTVRVVVGVLLTAGSVAAVVLGITAGQAAPVVAAALGSLLGVATLAPVLARPVVRALSAALPRLAGIRGVLARENAVRNPRRTAATASALMIGVALVGSITCFAASGKHSITASFDKEFRGDLVVESGAYVYGGFSPRLAAALAERPEVAAAVPQRLAQAQVNGSGSELAGWPADTTTVFDLDLTPGSTANLGRDGIAVGTSYAEKQDLRLGSAVTVVSADGVRRQLTVRALVGHTDWTGAVFVSRAAFAELQPGSLDARVYVRAADGVGTAALRTAVDAVTAAYANADVLDRDGLRDEVAGSFNAMLGVVYGMLALAIVIALLGIANTVALSVVERTRELGLLRAVGMARGHVRGMVRWEAALIAVFGTAIGLAVGLFLGWAMVFAISRTVETAEFVVPVGQLAVIVVVAGLAGVLAALLPARRAARLDVLDAIATT